MDATKNNLKMSRAWHLIIILVTITLVGSCKKSDLAHENQFDRSYQAWLNFKKSSFDSYTYRVSSGSWTGTGVETTLTVKAGKVVQRDYERKNIDRTTNQPFTEETWSESLDSLNTHSYGAPALTLDDIYDAARTEWLTKRKDAKIYFEADNAGMISQCGYVDKNCVDDCFTGIRINYIQAL